MRQLDCGCETSDDGSNLLSMCSMHAGHMRARHAIEKTMNAESVRRPESERELERELIKLLAPVVLARWSVVTDAVSSAEATFQHVREIMRRLD